MVARTLACLLLLATPAAAAPPEVLNPTVLSTRPHDTGAYTQGLVLYDGSLYESTGLYGQSSLRQVNPSNGTVMRSINLDPAYFGEGLARVDNRLIQLTWQEGVAFIWDLETFTSLGQFTYSGDGWGLCYDGTRLIMSNGSSQLTFRDPTDFHVLGTLDVTLEDPPGTVTPRDRLNELECVGTSVYANVYGFNSIVEIDVTTGEIVRVINAPDLLTTQEAAAADVLNGIAYDTTSGHFLITGKLWPKLFEVRFGPEAPADGAPTDGASPGDPGAGDSLSGDPNPCGDPASLGDSTGAGDANRASNGKVTSKSCAAAPTPVWLWLLLVLRRPRK